MARMLLLGILSVGAFTNAVDAPITSVTVYSDRARVVRTAQLTVSGTQRVELPTLRGTVDASSIRVEAEGAEVTRVDLRPVGPEALVPSEARKVLDAPSQERALACLQRFGERLRGFDRHAVRAVGTNTLRAAKNASRRSRIFRSTRPFSLPRATPTGFGAK